MMFLEIFNTSEGIFSRKGRFYSDRPRLLNIIDLFEDISLAQWLALTPPEMVKAHLGVDDTFISQLNKTKQTVVGPH